MKLFSKSLLTLIFLLMLVQCAVYAQQTKALIDARLSEEIPKNGWLTSDIGEYIIADQYTDRKTGLTYAYTQQKHNNIIVFNAISVFLIKGDEVLHFKPGLIGQLQKKIKTNKPEVSPEDAIRQTLRILGKNELAKAKWLSEEKELNIHRYEMQEISAGPVKVQLVYRLIDEKVYLAWDVSMEMKDEAHWWNVRVDALTGDFIDKNDFTTACEFGDLSHGFLKHDHSSIANTVTKFPPLVPEYTVFPFPIEAPSFGSQSLLSDPSNATASPFGWHDVDGVTGNDYVITRGNNVYAYEDADNNNLPGYSPTSATLQFNFPFTSGAAPLTNQDASITNLFYANNRIHDVLYNAGFDEVAGNFQQNNYGNGGLGNDYVKAEAFDGGGTNNANFSTPADGAPGRMQMYLWSGTPQIDGSFDNGIIAHEYAHGVSNRLTGGPSQASCLFNAEQGGEGWSDWLALIMTIEPGDNGAMARGIGTYAKGQPTNGPGIRRYPYSTNMTINPQTYADLAGSTTVHRKGEIWCDAIWDMTWFLIDDLGFNSDPMVTTSGNYIAMRLVLEGMKLQPCSPGFLDARDAILLADAILYNNAHRCRIWEAFARRGMGYNAVQGSSSSSTDQVAGFNMPPFCMAPTQVPVAAFNSDIVTVACGSAVRFTDQSTQPFSWLWDFGDNTTSTLQNPLHYFNTPGVFTVTLTVTNPLGSDSETKTITVNASFSATVNATPANVCNGAPVNVNAVVTGSNNITYSVTSVPYAPLTGTATNVSLTDDAMSTVKPIGFTFKFFGQNYSNFYICSNGYITFSSGQSTSAVYGSPVPSSASPNNFIALAWNDLDPTGVASAVSYFNTGVAPNRKLVVQYNTRHYGNAAYTYVVQAILSEGSNEIEIHTTTISDASGYDASATTTQGVENASGTAGVAVPGRNGNIFTASNDAYRFTPYTPYTYSWVPGNLSGQSQSVYPSVTGPVTVNIADGTGCVQPFTSPVITVDPCTVMQLNVFLEGFYSDINTMRANRYDLGLSVDPTETDEVTVNLWAASNLANPAPDYSAIGVLHTNGLATVQFPQNLGGQSYYVSVKHRNHIETWSANPITFSPPNGYNFTDAQLKAYDNGVDANPPMAAVAGGKFALYGGDVNQDGGVDGLDASNIEIDANVFAFGYFATDANGDGSTDGLDASVVEINSNLFIFFSRP